MHRIVLLRHGESVWNLENRFTGWTDVGLTQRGVEEAKRAGEIMKEGGFVFDSAYTSVLKRAIKTLWLALESMDLMWIPVHHSWRLNERHYGALQGLNKAETAAKFGDEQVLLWRRSYDVPPPALARDDARVRRGDPRYADLPESEMPLTECLKDTVARFVPYWNEIIAPEVRMGRRVIIVAHGNSLRALVKYLDQVGEREIVDLNIPTGIPLVYELDAGLRPLRHYYLGDPAEAVVLDQLFDLLVKNGKAGEVEKRIDSLIAKRPDSPHLHALRGRIALIQGQPERAEQEFARSLELEPKEATALSGQALLLQAKGDLPAAIERMNQAALADPSSGAYDYMSASMTLTLGDRSGAMEKFESILRLHPEQVGAANDLAFLLAEDSADLPRAQKYAERAVRLQPSPETLDTLGFVKLRQGAAEEAVGLFERALARKPDYSTARYHMALALVEKGEPEAARKALQEALSQSFPEEQEARNVLAKMDSGEGRP